MGAPSQVAPRDVAGVDISRSLAAGLLTMLRVDDVRELLPVQLFLKYPHVDLSKDMWASSQLAPVSPSSEQGRRAGAGHRMQIGHCHTTIHRNVSAACLVIKVIGRVVLLAVPGRHLGRGTRPGARSDEANLVPL